MIGGYRHSWDRPKSEHDPRQDAAVTTPRQVLTGLPIGLANLRVYCTGCNRTLREGDRIWVYAYGEIETIDELPAAGRAFGQAVVARGERLSQLEAQVDVLQQSTDPSTKVEKVATVLAFAANKAAADRKVAVTPAEIRGCTGVSRRYAYDLVETIAADVDGVRVRESKQVTTGSGTEHKQKALLVDCEAVHRLDEAVNSFTTANGGDDDA